MPDFSGFSRRFVLSSISDDYISLLKPLTRKVHSLFTCYKRYFIYLCIKYGAILYKNITIMHRFNFAVFIVKLCAGKSVI